MHPRTREILDHLDASHADLQQAVRAVPVELRERRPAPEKWSTAEVVEHLALVEERIGAALAGPLASAASAGAEERETSSVMTTLPVEKIVDRNSPLVAGESSLPKGGLSMQDAWDALERQRDTLRQAVIAADGRALGEFKHKHPHIGELNLYQWLIFVGAHESRHAAQVREIAAMLRDVPAVRVQ